MHKYAIIGFGGLGKKHLINLLKLEQERGDFQLQAVCGADPDALKENVKLNIGEIDLSAVDFSNCHFYQDYKEMLDKEQLDFVLSTLPTYLHEEVAVYALNKGINVFSEKPMALSLDSCENMIRAAETNGKELMIGQSLRFDPAYCKLKEYVDNNTFGKAYRAEFYRYSQKPCWTWRNWILDPTKSGGCALDMHVHDVDLINWLFGMPSSLQSAITEKKVELEAIFTQYFYDDLLVLSRADWSLPQTFPFEARCLVNFEEATVVISGGKITVYQDENSFSPELADETSHMREMRVFLKLVLDKEPTSLITPQSACDSVRLALKEIESGKNGKRIFL